MKCVVRRLNSARLRSVLIWKTVLRALARAVMYRRIVRRDGRWCVLRNCSTMAALSLARRHLHGEEHRTMCEAETEKPPAPAIEQLSQREETVVSVGDDDGGHVVVR